MSAFTTSSSLSQRPCPCPDCSATSKPSKSAQPSRSRALVQVSTSVPRPIRITDPHELIPLSSSSSSFYEISSLFRRGWQHPNKEASLKNIFLLQKNHVWDLQEKKGWMLGDGIGGGIELLFHGTRRACRLGEDTNLPCLRNDCVICSILRNSFRLGAARTGGMFGQGIYSTPVSSNIYAMNHHIRSQMHAILLCRVNCSSIQYVNTPENARMCPDGNFTCVKARTRREGGSVEYREVIVYKEADIIPYGLITYTRKGWS